MYTHMHAHTLLEDTSLPCLPPDLRLIGLAWLHWIGLSASHCLVPVLCVSVYCETQLLTLWLPRPVCVTKWTAGDGGGSCTKKKGIFRSHSEPAIISCLCHFQPSLCTKEEDVTSVTSVFSTCWNQRVFSAHLLKQEWDSMNWITSVLHLVLKVVMEMPQH